MSVTAQGQAERAELEAVLASGIFSRAPNLANFLRYICDQHFQGESDAIKEYCIAVEALGRSADFDQKKDSIVRVEAHRLRKRLASYYQGPGANHEIQIEIPNGQYAVVFRYVTPKVVEPELVAFPIAPERVEEALSSQTERVETPQPEQVSAPGQRLHKLLVLAAIASLILAVSAVALVRWRQSRATLTASEVWRGNFLQPVPSEYRFIAGYHGAPFIDRQQRTWQADAFYEGGLSTSFPSDRTWEGITDSNFPKTQREGNFSYRIPVRQGTYEVHLYFVEAQPGDPADPNSYSRLFQVYVNDKLTLDAFDPVSEAGAPYRLHGRVFRDITPSKDGTIHLRFVSLSRKPILTAAEVLSSRPGRVRPVRIVAAKTSATDSNGSVWVADEDAIGGLLVERRDSIQDPDLKILFSGERYGNFSYHIPAAAGKYRLRLFFAETYFGSKLPFASLASPYGNRIFNVFSNGVALLRDFDVAKEAQGPNRALIRTFDNIEPNAQGVIALEFVPVRNYAEVNAIEITQMDAPASSSAPASTASASAATASSEPSHRR